MKRNHSRVRELEHNLIPTLLERLHSGRMDLARTEATKLDLHHLALEYHERTGSMYHFTQQEIEEYLES